MPGVNSTLPAGNLGTPPELRPAENIGMALLRRAALEDDAYREDCCALCHSAEIERVWMEGNAWVCANCGAEGVGLEDASHLADALRCFDDPYRKVEPHDVAALVEHAATLHMQVRELQETLREERAAIHQLAHRVSLAIPRIAPASEPGTVRRAS